MIVGERLKAIRESKHLSQGHIEEKAGLMRSYVSRVENGHTVPSIETLEKWARALGITLSALFADDGETTPLMPALKIDRKQKLGRVASNHLRRVEAAFANMSPRYMEIVSALARKFADQ
jgi:transcriptional regulator with XRE-family HTH domain